MYSLFYIDGNDRTRFNMNNNKKNKQKHDINDSEDSGGKSRGTQQGNSRARRILFKGSVLLPLLLPIKRMAW